MNSQEYIEVSLSVSPFSEENAEILMAELSDLPFETFDYADPCLKCYVQKELYDPQALKVVLSGLDYDFKVELANAILIPAENWNAEWEGEFQPIIIEGLCTVKALHHRDIPRTRFNISIDPAMAFGTGHHQTTYMMCKALLDSEEAVRGKVVMDMGCGTAVLAILAAKLGAAEVFGIDIDAVAAVSAHRNVRSNRVSKKVKIGCGDASLLQAGHYDVLLANINRNILVQDMRTYARSLRSGGLLYVSGFYEEDLPIVRAAAQEWGLIFVLAESREQWCCARFKKTN